ncbi:hypothetical protein K501DRAFT_248609 [Backusella circina FSU 941]|nr:hypothetical protein K501DRAFT_248609 [Backusella circina FSU 941]
MNSLQEAHTYGATNSTSGLSPVSISPSSPSFSVSFSPISSTGSFSPKNLNDTNVQTLSSSVPVEEHQPSASRRSVRTQRRHSYFTNLDVEQEYKPRNTQSSSGRKRRIVFEGDDAEERRQKFLERNRVAAYKCRQKKKNWVQELEQRAESVDKQNEELRDTVAQLKEGSRYLRNLLLTHGDCNCESVQTYLRQTSAQLTESFTDIKNPPNVPVVTPQNSLSMTPMFQTSLDSTCGPFSTYPPFSELSTGLTPFFDTSMDQSEPIDYFS